MPAAGDRILATDTATLTSYVLTPPICRLIQQAAQTITAGTTPALTFGAGSEDIDTNNFHDPTTNNTRITPSIAGYYEFDAMLHVVPVANAINLQIFIMKNGVIAPPGWFWAPAFTNTGYSGYSGKTILSANGTTDFFEARAGVATQNATTQVSGGINSTFQCTFLRPL